MPRLSPGQDWQGTAWAPPKEPVGRVGWGPGLQWVDSACPCSPRLGRGGPEDLGQPGTAAQEKGFGAGVMGERASLGDVAQGRTPH